jgi:hypothetical protein
MSVLELRLDRKPDSQGLNAQQVVEQFTKSFPEATACLEDKLATQTQRAKQLLAESGGEDKEHVLQTLQRNASRNGPQYSFSLASTEGKRVKGYVQRYVIAFLYDEPLAEELQNRLVRFLKGFGTGVIKKTDSDGRVEELPR